jgi:hypothetical protein
VSNTHACNRHPTCCIPDYRAPLSPEWVASWKHAFDDQLQDGNKIWCCSLHLRDTIAFPVFQQNRLELHWQILFPLLDVVQKQPCNCVQQTSKINVYFRKWACLQNDIARLSRSSSQEPDLTKLYKTLGSSTPPPLSFSPCISVWVRTSARPIFPFVLSHVKKLGVGMHWYKQALPFSLCCSCQRRYFFA